MKIYKFENIKELIDCSVVYGDLIPDTFKLVEEVFIKKDEQEVENGIKYTFENESGEEIEYIQSNYYNCYELESFEYRRADKIYKLKELIDDLEVKEEYIDKFIDTINKNA